MLVLALERLKLLVHVHDNESNASSCSWKGKMLVQVHDNGCNRISVP